MRTLFLFLALTTAVCGHDHWREHRHFRFDVYGPGFRIHSGQPSYDRWYWHEGYYDEFGYWHEGYWERGW